MHGAVVSYKDYGIIFTASPGGGKSTQAQLWQKLYQAQILNGDKAMIRLKDGCCMVYGSPWSGSSKYKQNKGVPLKAIISLQKGDNNETKNIYISRFIYVIRYYCHRRKCR